MGVFSAVTSAGGVHGFPAALDVAEQPGVPVTGVLAQVLAAQQILLVLDNCEHVIGAAAQLCAWLLGAFDDVRVLATSREPLRAAGEVRYRLGPLTLPGLDESPDVGGSEAVALFTDRARQADPHFALDREQAPAVARLVRRLDGIPLAIELAAVAGEGAGAAVLRLVDCSLLAPPRAGPDGRPRYALLETLRAYGAVLADGAGEAELVAAAQARYAVKVAEQAAAGLQTVEGEAAAARGLDAEDAMMRQVLAWALDRDTALALRLTVALAPWWALRGGLPSQYPLLRRAAAHAEVGSDGWCATEFWLGMTARFSADMAGALGHFTAVRDAVQDRGPSGLLADALNGRASVLREMTRIAEAVEDARALALAREISYPAGEVRALSTSARPP